MGEIINSISFQDQHVSWIQAEVGANQTINIIRVAESPLPFVINLSNLQKSATIAEIAHKLKLMKTANDFGAENVRFLLPARFGLVKKVYVDQYIPENAHSDLIRSELSHILTVPVNDYIIYHPEYWRENNFLKELLAVALRKELYSFFRNIAEEAQLSLQQINLNCFAIDELYRRFFPNLIGETLLVNFIENGYEIILCDQKFFINYLFKPYTRNFQSIDQLSDKEVVTNFVSIVEDLQRPGSVDVPLYSISQIFVFGHPFQPDLLPMLLEQNLPTTRILNPTDSSEWQIVFNDPAIHPEDAFRIVEPLSNLF